MTMDNIQKDIEYLNEYVPNAVIKVVANKSDLILEEDLEKIVGKSSISTDAVTSAKTGANIDELFENLAREVIQQ